MSSRRIIPPHPTDANSKHDDQYYQRTATDALLAAKADASALTTVSDTVTTLTTATNALDASLVATQGRIDPGVKGDNYTHVAMVANTPTNVDEPWIDPRWLGADPSGATDSLAAINDAFAASNRVRFHTDGTYLVSGTVTLSTGYVLMGTGPGKTIVKAQDGTATENVVYALAQDGIVIRDVEVDANWQGRETALDTAVSRTNPIHLSGCTNATVDNVMAKNARGNGTIPGVGVILTGSDSRVINSWAIDCGEVGKAADGFFMTGDRLHASNSFAINCLDTGFVLERCNYSSISDCTADGSSAGAAIGAGTTGLDYYGNSIRGLTVKNWNASNTGGIQLLTSTTGSLYDTDISDVILVQEDASGGVGTAIMMRETGAGRIIGVTISNPTIDGADDHGIAIRGKNITVLGGSIRNVNTGGAGAACIRVDATAEDVYVAHVKMEGVAATFPVLVSDGAQNVTIESCKIDGSSVATYGIFFFGTVTNARANLNDITGTTTGFVGSDAGTTPMVVTFDPTSGKLGLLFGKERDTNLYRDSANVLRTDDAMVATSFAVGSGTVGVMARLYSGTGSPEGVVAARLGSLYMNISGGAGVSFYVKESGAGLTSGWVAK